MRALITGSTGFVGSYLAEHLLDCGDSVLGCSTRGTWSPDVPSRLSSQVPLFSWDLVEGLTTACRRRVEHFQPEAIYHLAAISVPRECGAEDPTEKAVAANVIGTQAVLALAAALPRPPRLLLASSCYVYAPVDVAAPVVDESATIDPANGYGKTKLAAEQATVDAHRRGTVDAVIARAFQHTGPRQSSVMILPQWARQLASGGDKPLQVVCRDAHLDLTDVRDVVRAYRALVTDKETAAGKSPAIFNVGSGISRRSGDLLDQLQTLAGDERDVRELAPGRRQQPIADISRLTQTTGWTPLIPMATTLRDILNFWLQRKVTE